MSNRARRYRVLLIGAVVLTSATIAFVLTSSARRTDGLHSDSLATDEAIHQAADALLAAMNPALPSNLYFPEAVKARLQWFSAEHAASRITLQLRNDLAPDVVMASARENDHAVIYLSTGRLASDLALTGRVTPPFSPRQRNDFAIALVHEIVHMQNLSANPNNSDAHAQEELRVWRLINLEMVRPLREQGQPISPSLLEIDDALRACRDQLPCPSFEALVRLRG